MQWLVNKRIVLGISGGVAAYKSAHLVRLLKTAGAQVQVVMTPSAMAFITPLSLQALSGNPVRHDLLDTAAEAAMGHIELARWADFIIIAPASANFIARLSHGLADDLLTTLCLASDAPIAIAPAMNRSMYLNPATQSNLKILQQRGVLQWGPAEGEQACGEVGPGRMLEAQQVLQSLADHFAPGSLAQRRVLITAGPTQEAVDPVRFMSNYSSGKMGYALARAARDAGAEVILVSGPVALTSPRQVERVDVTTAEQMFAAVMDYIADVDIFIAAAAVSDYRFANPVTDKIKKSDTTLSLELVPNPDILAHVAALAERPFCVGFAAETQDVLANATHKLAHKQLDMIVANDVSKAGIGFGCDDNEVTLIYPDREVLLRRASKAQIAENIISLIVEQIQSEHLYEDESSIETC